MPLLVDAGILYALADRSDAWHARAVGYLTQFRPALLAPVTVIPEAAYLVRTRLGEPQERKLVDALVNGGVAVEPLRDADVARTAVLMAKYPDLGFADCSVVAIAERLALDTIATTDRRHFTLVRPRHLTRFTLVP
jgi:predicted nucleic acid-binding protein